MNFRTFTSEATESIAIDGPPYPKQLGSSGVTARTVVEIVGSGWTGSLVPQARFSPTGPLHNVPYRNLLSGTDASAGTAITADAVIEVSVPGVHGLSFAHTRSAGSVALNVTGLLG